MCDSYLSLEYTLNLTSSAFYPNYISVVNLLQSLHFGGALNHKRRFVRFEAV